MWRFGQVSNRVRFSPDEPPAGGAAGGGDQGGDQGAGWTAALPDEQKGNEYVKTFEKPGDFVQASLDLKTEHEGLKAKMDGAIFKPGEDATDDEKSAYRDAMGIPESAEGYEFPKTEGVEQDPKMMEWAAGVFHEAGVSKDAAAHISQQWDGFMQSMEQAMADADLQAEKDGVATAEAALKEKWGADYDQNIKTAERGYQAFEKAVPGFAELLATELPSGIRLGNHPLMTEIHNVIGKAIGDDLSMPTGNPPRQPADDKTGGGLKSIYKTPNPEK